MSVSGAPTQKCRSCGVEKPWEEFHRDAAKASRHAVECKPCARARVNKWYREQQPEAIRAVKRDYYRRNRETISRQRRQYREATRSAAESRRSGYQWTGPELELASRDDLTHGQVAEKLGRSLAAVKTMRWRLRSEPLLSHIAGTP